MQSAVIRCLKPRKRRLAHVVYRLDHAERAALAAVGVARRIAAAEDYLVIVRVRTDKRARYRILAHAGYRSRRKRKRIALATDKAAAVYKLIADCAHIRLNAVLALHIGYLYIHPSRQYSKPLLRCARKRIIYSVKTYTRNILARIYAVALDGDSFKLVSRSFVVIVPNRRLLHRAVVIQRSIVPDDCAVKRLRKYVVADLKPRRRQLVVASRRARKPDYLRLVPVARVNRAAADSKFKTRYRARRIRTAHYTRRILIHEPSVRAKLRAAKLVIPDYVVFRQRFRADYKLTRSVSYVVIVSLRHARYGYRILSDVVANAVIIAVYHRAEHCVRIVRQCKARYRISVAVRARCRAVLNRAVFSRYCKLRFRYSQLRPLVGYRRIPFGGFKTSRYRILARIDCAFVGYLYSVKHVLIANADNARRVPADV